MGMVKKRVQFLAASAFGEVASEEVEEGLHLCVECLITDDLNHLGDRGYGGVGTHLLGLGILDGVDEGRELVAHGLGGDASGGGLEIDVGRAAYAGVEGLCPGHEGVGRHGTGRLIGGERMGAGGTEGEERTLTDDLCGPVWWCWWR